jgi:hypothetical protein
MVLERHLELRAYGYDPEAALELTNMEEREKKDVEDRDNEASMAAVVAKSMIRDPVGEEIPTFTEVEERQKLSSRVLGAMGLGRSSPKSKLTSTPGDIIERGGGSRRRRRKHKKKSLKKRRKSKRRRSRRH